MARPAHDSCDAANWDGLLHPADLQDDGGLARLTGLFAVRTRFFDHYFADAGWPTGTTVYEIDQPHVIEFKTRTLR